MSSRCEPVTSWWSAHDEAKRADMLMSRRRLPLQGDTSGALETLTDAEIESAKQELGTIASAIPGYDKWDPRCNGFVCNAGAVGMNISCADAFIAEAKQAYCGVRATDNRRFDRPPQPKRSLRFGKHSQLEAEWHLLRRRACGPINVMSSLERRSTG